MTRSLRTFRRLTLGAVAALALAATPAGAAPGDVLTIEEEARRKAEEAVREEVVQLIYRERILQVPPETFHASVSDPTRPLLNVAEDLLFLDLAASLLERGGVENIDRIREATLAWRARSARDAARSREVLADRLKPSPDEVAEGKRTALPLADALRRGEERPADLPPLQASSAAAGSAPPPAPLDYIPVPPEDLAALRERTLASGRPVNEEWYARLARDPIAENRWKQQRRDQEMNIARLQTAWTVDKGVSFQLGTWIQDVWQRKDPFGLAIMSVFVLALAGVVLLAFKLLRKDT